MSTTPAIKLNKPMTLQGVTVTDIFASSFTVKQKSMLDGDVASQSLAFVINGYNPENGKPLYDEDGIAVVISKAVNLALLRQVYPTPDAHLAAIKQDLPALIAVLQIEEAISASLIDAKNKEVAYNKIMAKVTALQQQDINTAKQAIVDYLARIAGTTDQVVIDASNKSIADFQASIKEIENGPIKDKDAIAAKDALTAAYTLAWKTLPEQWWKIAPALGVTDVNQLPMSLLGLIRPDGI